MGFFHSITHAFHHITHDIGHEFSHIYKYDILHPAESIVKDVAGLFGIKNRTEILKDLRTIDMISQTGLYKNKLVRLYANNKDLLKTYRSLLTDKIYTINHKIFERLGATVKFTGVISEVNKETVENYLIDNEISSNPTVSNIVFQNSILKKQIDYLSLYEKRDLFSQSGSESLSNGTLQLTYNIYYIENQWTKPILSNGTLSIDSNNNYEFYILDTTTADTFTGDGITTTFDLSNDYAYKITSVSINDTVIDSSEYSLNNAYSIGSNIEFNTAPADKDSISITYIWLDNNSTNSYLIPEPTNNKDMFNCVYSDSTGSNILFVEYSDNIEQEINDTTFMVYPFKKNGNFVSNTKYLDIALTHLGFKADDIKPQILDSSVKYVIVTLATKFNDPNTKQYFDAIYGTSSIHRTITINNSDFNMKYYWDSNNNFNAEFNGNKVDINDYWVMIPVNFFEHISPKRYYDIKEYCTRMFTLSEKEITIKWYQSSQFKVFTFVGMLTLSYFTAGQSLAVWATTMGITTSIFYVIKIIVKSKYLRLVADTAAAAAMGQYSKDITVTEKAIDVAGFSIQLSNLYFTGKFNKEYNNIENDINETHNKIDEYEKEISEMKKQGIYTPIDSTQAYYDIIYELPNIYYNSIYDYDSIYS